MSSTNRLINVFIISFSIFIVTLLLFNASTLKKVESNKEVEQKVSVSDNNENSIESVTEKTTPLNNQKQFNFTSFTAVKNGYHETVIVDKETGAFLEFKDLLKEDEVDKFWNKVYELLDLKYPKFIVNTLKNSEGNVYYDIKENEVIIYFENYKFDPIFLDVISIKVNYNEVKDCLNFTPKLDDEYINESAYHYDKNKKTIAFSFDDGPSGKYTREIVDALKDNKAKATFFMVGNKMNNYKSSLLYVYENNLEIGSHTYSHINMKKKTINQIEEELKKTNDIFYNITGSNINLVRPPYGAYNDNILNNIDYPFITWNIDTNDWRYRNKEHIVNHILANVTDGSIILMHDSYESTVEAVKEVLPRLYALGYQVVTVSDLAVLKGATIENNRVYSYFR